MASSNAFLVASFLATSLATRLELLGKCENLRWEAVAFWSARILLAAITINWWTGAWSDDFAPRRG